MTAPTLIHTADEVRVLAALGATHATSLRAEMAADGYADSEIDASCAVPTLAADWLVMHDLLTALAQVADLTRERDEARMALAKRDAGVQP